MSDTTTTPADDGGELFATLRKLIDRHYGGKPDADWTVEVLLLARIDARLARLERALSWTKKPDPAERLRSLGLLPQENQTGSEGVA